MNDSRVAGSLFIDMKFTSLYHKLGYGATEHPDSFIKRYRDCEVLIESESQYFKFNGEEFSLNRHVDFVILELLNRLLNHGYHFSEIEIRESGIILRNEKQTIFFICEVWGSDFKNRIFKDSSEIQVAYTSRLNGGLIEYKIHPIDSSYSQIFFKGDYENHTPSDSQIRYIGNFGIMDARLVEYIGNEANVTIPEGVSYLDAGVFWDKQSIRKVTLPKTLRVIGGDAFAYCEGISKIVIPKNVEIMGDNPFGGCVNLHITNKSPHFVLEDDVLFTKDKTRLIHYSPWKSDTEYSIGDCVEWIGKHGFYKCINLKKITIGRNVNYMGNNPFSDCVNLTLKNKSPHFQYANGALLSGDGSLILHYSLGAEYDEYRVPDSVKTIGRNSFWNCTGLKRIIIGKNVRQIGYNPFANCLNLKIESDSPFYNTKDGVLYDSSFNELVCCTNEIAKSGIEVSDRVKNIGRNAFSGCESLETITLPASVETISRGAFTNCINLREVHIEGNVKIIDKWAFAYCSSLKKIKINSHANVHPDAFMGSDTEVLIC